MAAGVGGGALTLALGHVLAQEHGEYQAIHDLTLDIGAGQTVALVGATGAGKSTLAISLVWLRHRLLSRGGAEGLLLVALGDGLVVPAVGWRGA